MPTRRATPLHSTLTELVLVPGHAVFLGAAPGTGLGTDAETTSNDRSWALQSFQQGEPVFYIEHIRTAVALAAASPRSLLLFSGGATRRGAGPITEAAGYRAVADHLSWWSHDEVSTRTALEEFARDSFENLLFGIARFRECTGRYPEHVTVVSWRFKAARMGAHRDAIRFPGDRFRYLGVNEPLDPVAAEEGEARTLAHFQEDPYGTGPHLSARRLERNPFMRQHAYAETCAELAPLFRHLGPALFTRPLPWASAGEVEPHFGKNSIDR